MSYLFYGCKSLLSLPDISKWDFNDFIEMRGIFNRCESLISLPNISTRNINNYNPKKLYQIIFEAKDNMSTKEIFNHKLIKNYKNICKIIYMNKIMTIKYLFIIYK